MALDGGLVAAARVLFSVETGDLHHGMREAESDVHRSTGRMRTDIDHMTRGVVAGSGAFRGLARSVAFASSGFLGAAGFTAVVKQSIDVASDLHEQINKVNVIFGRNASQVLTWSRDSARAMGISRNEVLSYAATFGNFLKPMGVAESLIPKVSMNMVKLAADVASFNNANPQDVLLAMQSALAGQIEPMRRYGVFLDQNRIKAEAFATGLAKSRVDVSQLSDSQEKLSLAQHKYNVAVEEHGAKSAQAATSLLSLHSAQRALNQELAGSTGDLNAAQKALASYQIIVKDTKSAHGDFARTSDGLANQLRILKAELKDSEAVIGTALLPDTQELVSHLAKWLEVNRANGNLQRWVNTGLHDASVVAGDLRDVVEELWPMLKKAAETSQDVAEAVGGWENAFKIILAGTLAAKFIELRKAIVGTSTAIGVTGAGAFGTGGAKAGTGLAGRMAGLAALAANPIVFTIAIQMVASTPQGQEVAGLLPDIFDSIQKGHPLDAIFGKEGKRGAVGNWLFPPSSKSPQAGTSQVGSGITNIAPRGSNATPAQEKLIANAFRYGPGSGITYAWGKASPKEGYDCSGYVYDMYRRNGIAIPRDSRSQWNDPNAIEVPIGAEEPGDAVYFEGSRSGANAGPPPGHVGLYIGGGKFIQYFSSGQPAKVSRLDSRSDYMGARRWLKLKASPAGSTTPSAGKRSSGTHGYTDTGKSSSSPDVPYSIQQQLASARLSPGTKDDIAALQTQRGYIQGRLKGKLSSQQRVSYTNQLADVNDQIGALVNEGRYATARGLGTLGGVGGLLDKFGQMSSGQIFKPVNVKGLGKILRPLEPTIQDWKSLKAALARKLTAALQRKATIQRQLKRAAKVKHKDPKLIASLRGALTDINQTIATLRADIGLSDAAIEDLVKTAKSKEQELAGEIESYVDNVNASAGDIPTDLALQLAQAEGTVDTADDVAALQAQKSYLQNELDTGVVNTATGTAPLNDQGRLAIQQQLNAINQRIGDLSTIPVGDLTALPPELQFQLAQAAGTPDVADDIDALSAAEQIYSSRLSTAPIEQKAGIQNALNDVRSRLAELRQEKTIVASAGAAADQSVVGYLTALRGLRSDASNVVGASMRGATIQVTNYFGQGPEDPHLWTKGLEFDLKAAIG